MATSRSRVREYKPGEVEEGKDPTTGKFVPGNTLGRGQLVQRRAKHYLDLISKCVTDKDVQRIVNRAKKDAAGGDHRARAWIFQHLIGRDPMAQMLFLAQGTHDPQMTMAQCKEAIQGLRDFRKELEKTLDKMEEVPAAPPRDVPYEVKPNVDPALPPEEND